MRIAVTGTTGRVGRALADRLADRHEIIEVPRSLLDLASPDPAGPLEPLDFDILLHPAAMTGLEACEDDPDLAYRVNAHAPKELARLCANRGKRIIAFSTDYVFGGHEPGLRTEEEKAEPLSVYGASKLAGEEGVIEAGGTVVRVSWVFGPEKAAFPDQVFDDALAGRPLAAVADKYSLPAFTGDLADWIAGMLSNGFPPGILHACNSGDPVTWHDLACETVGFLHEHGHLPAVPEVRRLGLSEIPFFRAARPWYTAMSTDRLTGLLGVRPRDWRDALKAHLADRISR